MASFGAFPGDSPGKADRRAMCKYGEKCYQINPMHREKFRHPKPHEKNEEAGRQEAIAHGEEEKVEIKVAEGDVRDPDDENEAIEPPAKKLRAEDSSGEACTKEENQSADVSRNDDEGEDKENARPIEEEQVQESEEGDEEEVLPESPEDARDSIKQKFLMNMPEDFYHFWEFCKSRNHSRPEDALLSLCGLKLVGPFEVLSGKLRRLKNRKPSEYLLHWRYYYDVPEFQTVLSNPETNFHIGYFRDDPHEDPVFVASNEPSLGCKMNVMGDNLFGALYNHISKLVSKVDPFKQTALQKLKEAVHVFATMKVQDMDLSLDIKTQRMKARDKKKIANVFHGLGMVVPYDRKTQVGYREIPETAASLKRIFKNLTEASTDEGKCEATEKLQELITNVQFANDEGDPGMGLELGLDAFCYGGERLHSYISHLLGVGYELLNRQEFGRIAQAHLKKRNQGGCFQIQ